MSVGDRVLRVEVVAGGRPDAATVNAIGLAVRAVIGAAPSVAPAGGGSTGWRRAALREGVGGRPEVGPDGRG